MLVFTHIRYGEWSIDTPRQLMDIIIPRDVNGNIGRPKKDAVPIIIEKQGITVTTGVMADNCHEDELQY